MEQLKNGLLMTKEEIDYTEWDKDKFDEWTKMQIYQAYLLEVKKTKKLYERINSLQYIIAEVRHLTK